VAWYLEQAEIDVVHSILPSAYLVAVGANILTKRRPLVMSRLSLNWYQREQRLFAVIERLLLHRRVEIVIGNSLAVLRELRGEGLPERKLRLIRNGIDAAKVVKWLFDTQEARRHLGITPQALVFSSVGNLFPYKGHADLLNALCLIRDQLPQNWVLLAAGRDVRGGMAKLYHLAVELGLSQYVRLLGERLDIPVILSAADIHVSASHHESLPNNILEAMCARLPIVATAVGGVPEQVIDGVTGILVPARNPVALSKALLSLACNPDLRTAMGRHGLERVELEFPIAQSVRALEEAYASVA
jgi:glycosyltransferase involved in cell wall biosynthesis